MRLSKSFSIIGVCMITMLLAASGQATAALSAPQFPPLLLKIKQASLQGLVMAPVNLTSLSLTNVTNAPVLQPIVTVKGQAIPAQFVPDADFDMRRHAIGTLILQLPHGGDWNADLRFVIAPVPDAKAKPEPDTAARIMRTPDYALTFDPKYQAGLPSRIVMEKTGRTIENFAWNDRVYDPVLGSFYLRLDPYPSLQTIATGPLCSVVRNRVHYCQADGKQPTTQPYAIYDWYIFRDRPLVFVKAVIRQPEPTAWAELHFLELNLADESFHQWAGGMPLQRGDLIAAKATTHLSDWGALLNGQDAIGMFGGPVIIYDGHGEYGTYLHSAQFNPWMGWSERERQTSAWLWIGSREQPTIAIQNSAAQYRQQARVARVALLRASVSAQISVIRVAAQGQPQALRQQMLWRVALAERQETQAQWQDTLATLHGHLPPAWSLYTAGDFGLAVRRVAGGVVLQSLFDLKTTRELLAETTPPLFTVTLHSSGKASETQLTAASGWQQAQIQTTANGFAIQWAKPQDQRLKGISVTAQAIADRSNHAWRWTLQVHNANPAWSVWYAQFPQLALAEPGARSSVLCPLGAGVVQHDVWNRAFSYHGDYPSGGCCIQLMAAYADGPQPDGLYCAAHDPYGSAKAMALDSDPVAHNLLLSYGHPAANRGVAGNGFTLSGEVVWQLLRGDWFDAAMIYKRWARNHALWWPKLSRDGRSDTPLWLRQMSLWAQTNGSAQEVVPPMQEFAQHMGQPVGLHWYNWHQIPFDNDYPHYFPSKPGFKDGVQALQATGVYVMPYINGRLWDTRDKGLADFEFSQKALPATAKDDHGQPYIENYGSKEQDGSPVRLGVMCPTTPLWQQTIRDTVLRLFNEMDTKGVYIDQIGAAAPALCMDPTHGHPLGGGHWWNAGYWQMLDAIRRAKPPDRILTTESNAEPFIRWFDGYLTWNWQYDGQVPLFPAIYGGTIQMFGRNYAGGPTKDLALHMKAGQQLVFGEQLGWLNPNVTHEPENAAFLRQLARLRRQLSRYFYAGEMARPPQFNAPVPTVTADWQWAGEAPVTTDAVLTGAWKLPQEKKLVLLFVNVSGQAVTTNLQFNAATYGITAAQLNCAIREGDNENAIPTHAMSNRFARRITFLPHHATVWELQW